MMPVENAGITSLILSDAQGEVFRHRMGFSKFSDELCTSREDRLFFGLPDAAQIGPHLETGDEVQGTKGLVHVDDVWIGGQGARDFNALLHPSR